VTKYDGTNAPMKIEYTDRRTDQIVQDFGDAVDRAARAAGWH
jgi:ribosome-binding protein aMBF1 (putative translation factor)